ncbi:MAG: hypothetical protein JWL61_1036 [Gemmatimonadetes bacterium]|nr:hypothetical protein [Gemmatimonadota bacterium]
MAILGLCFGSACGPRAHIPPRPVTVPNALDDSDSVARLARGLAPVLYLQRDEWFPLSRAVAVVHPSRRIIGYHLLWKDDVHGSWIPFTVPTDEEVIWVAYDSTNAPTNIWTFWHGSILHTDWRDRGTPAIDVQWGKHGSLPHGIIESDLPRGQKLNDFYALAFIGLPDILLGKLTRPGPSGFFHSYDRYRDFSRVMRLSDSLDVVVRAEDPRESLAAVFGRPYSRKRPWPDLTGVPPLGP